MTDAAPSANIQAPPVNSAPRKPQRRTSHETPPVGSCCGWLEIRPDGLYQLRCNCAWSAESGPLYPRRAA